MRFRAIILASRQGRHRYSHPVHQRAAFSERQSSGRRTICIPVSLARLIDPNVPLYHFSVGICIRREASLVSWRFR